MSLIRALLLLCVFVAPLAHAQVGHVVLVQGTAIVERAGQAIRTLAAGEKLEQRDVINVAQASHAVLELRDRTRITLRPNTVFRLESYADTGTAQGMTLGLQKGGFRATTGDIAKKNPQSVRFQTDTVVLGIRGTEFDARLCGEDCAEEERNRPLQRVRALAAGRVIDLTGTVNGVDATGATRTLVPGALLQEGESVATTGGASAIVALRDGSRITLGSNAQLVIARFHYEEANPQRGLAHLRLLAGNAHVYTGQLGKVGPDAFLFETPRGMIRAKGTGFSVSDALIVHTWDGTVIIQTATERIELPMTHGGAVSIVDGRIVFLPEPPKELLESAHPRPDRVSVDPATFGSGGTAPEHGLYVWVRQGAVTLGSGPEAIEVKAGSAVRAGGGGIAVLPAVPNFMRFDLTPRPGLPAAATTTTLPFFRGRDGAVVNMCSSN